MAFARRSVKEIIRSSGCSRTFISRDFRRKWAAPLAKLLHAVRLYWAILYLQEPDFRVKEIALKIGYASLSAFTSAFKKATGLTPMEFRAFPDQSRFPQLELLGFSCPDLASLQGKVRAAKAVLIDATRHRNRHRGMDVNSILEGRNRPARPFFNIGLRHCRHEISGPIDMSLEPFRRKFFFTYTLRGRVVLRCKDQELLIEPKTLIAHPTPLNITFHPNGECSRWHRYTVAFFGPNVQERFEAVTATHGFYQQVPPDSLPARRLVRIIRQTDDTQELIDRSRLAFDFLSAWHAYLDTHGNPLRDAIRFENCESKVIPYHTVKTVKELAEEVGYSRSHFSRKLRKQWQTATPGSIIRAGKLATASKLLRDTDLPIAQIANRIGYSSVAGFIGAFKRVYKQSPLRYRRMPE